MINLHFCGGLPRTGSTVLMNILQQNPNIFTTGTCPLTDILHSHILIKSRYREPFQAMSTDQVDKAMYGLIHGATKGWFEALTSKPTVISKNRNWSSLYHLYPKSKYIVTVRDLRDVVESFEKVNSKLLSLHSFNDSGTLVPSMHFREKFKHYFDEPNAFSSALNYEVPRMMEWYYRDRSKIFFLRYEDFCKDPNFMISKIYNFLGESEYTHDLNNINQSELYEHDNAYFRERTDHFTHSKFMFYTEPKRLLPKSFHERILEQNKWFYESFYPEALNE